MPGRGLPAASRSAGRLEAVVDRVADHVDQGVRELVDHPLVQLGLLAADLEDHLLARGEAQVADDPAEPLEQRPDRHHPGVEHALLQPVGDPAQAVDRLGERLDLLARLADQVELVLDGAEVVAEPADVGRPSVGRAAGAGRSSSLISASPSSPRVMLSSRSRVSEVSAWAFEPRNSFSSPRAIATNRALVITSSPARFIRWSSRSLSTRIVSAILPFRPAPSAWPRRSRRWRRLYSRRQPARRFQSRPGLDVAVSVGAAVT